MDDELQSIQAIYPECSISLDDDGCKCLVLPDFFVLKMKNSQTLPVEVVAVQKKDGELIEYLHKEAIERSKLAKKNKEEYYLFELLEVLKTKKTEHEEKEAKEAAEAAAKEAAEAAQALKESKNNNNNNNNIRNDSKNKRDKSADRQKSHHHHSGNKNSHPGGGGFQKNTKPNKYNPSGKNRQRKSKKSFVDETPFFTGVEEDEFLKLLEGNESAIDNSKAESIVSISEQKTRTRLGRIYDRILQDGYSVQVTQRAMIRNLGCHYESHLRWLLIHGKKEATKKEDKQSKSDTTINVSFELRDYEIPKSYTGKTPKTLLHEFCQKHKLTKPNFSKMRSKKGIRYKCSMTNEGNKVENWKKGDKKDFECPEACKDDFQASHLCACFALFELNKTRNLWTLLPKDYADAWKRWLNTEQKGEETFSGDDKSAFVEMLMGKLKNQNNTSSQGKNENKSSDNKDISNNSNNNNNNFHVSSTSNKEEEEDVEFSDPSSKRELEQRKRWFEKKKKEKTYQQMLETRQKLPVYGYRDQILRQVKKHSVVIVSGDTGSGKSTNVPQFILEECLTNSEDVRMVVTEPRRISAMSLAQRVSEEMNDDLGGMVGFKVRLEKKESERTLLTFVTNGILMRMLQSNPMLSDVTHIVLDEVHERSVEMDILLLLVKRLLTIRKTLKVVLMSATMDAEFFEAYFGKENCMTVQVPGRTFPCEIFYLEDVVKFSRYQLDEDSEYAAPEEERFEEVDVRMRGEKSGEVVEYAKSRHRVNHLDGKLYEKSVQRTISVMNHDIINHEIILETVLLIEKKYHQSQGSILVFLPSVYEIYKTQNVLQDHFGESKFTILPLHSNLKPAEQKKVFQKYKQRKLILSTNIAETGVTISDVVFVIDSTFENRLMYDRNSRISGLKMTRISQGSAKQRAGRAGRVQNGFVFRLCTRWTMEEEMEAVTPPEILRVSLENVILHILSMNLGTDCLGQCLSPPSAYSIESSLTVLKEMGGIDEDLTLTPLGMLMAKLPLSCYIAKMLIFSVLFQCITPISFVCAASQMSYQAGKNPLNSVKGSDHLSVYKEFKAWKNRTCDADYSKMRLLELSAKDLVRSVKSLFKNNREDLDENAQNQSVLNLVLCSGLFPRIGRVGKSGTVKMGKKKAFIHFLSVNSKAQNCYVAFDEIFKTATSLSIRKCSIVKEVHFVLFTNTFQYDENKQCIVTETGSVENVSFRGYLVLKAVRKEFQNYFAKALIHSKENEKGKLLKRFESFLKKK